MDIRVRTLGAPHRFPGTAPPAVPMFWVAVEVGNHGDKALRIRRDAITLVVEADGRALARRRPSALQRGRRDPWMAHGRDETSVAVPPGRHRRVWVLFRDVALRREVRGAATQWAQPTTLTLEVRDSDAGTVSSVALTDPGRAAPAWAPARVQAGLRFRFGVGFAHAQGGFAAITNDTAVAPFIGIGWFDLTIGPALRTGLEVLPDRQAGGQIWIGGLSEVGATFLVGRALSLRTAIGWTLGVTGHMPDDGYLDLAHHLTATVSLGARARDLYPFLSARPPVVAYLQFQQLIGRLSPSARAPDFVLGLGAEIRLGEQ